MPTYHNSLINKCSIEESMKIYWNECLLRSHFACITSILRYYNWLKGVEFGLDSENFIVFIAYLRGIFESVVDSHYSLWQRNFDIAENSVIMFCQ